MPSIKKIKQVTETLYSRKAGFCGGEKVWISEVATALGESVADIEALLLLAHRAGELVLARVDMPAGDRNGGVVKATQSEIRSNNSTYHAILAR